MVILDVAAAAARLGTDETGVCRRINDGTLVSTRDRSGHLFVFVDEPTMALVGTPAGAAAPPTRPRSGPSGGD
jgi:hypothetical protein